MHGSQTSGCLIDGTKSPGTGIVKHHLFMSHESDAFRDGSLEECRYYLILSQDLGYGQNESLTSTLEETSKLLNAYVRAILASGS